MTANKNETITISFLGDIMFGRNPPTISDDVSRHLERSDLVVGNLEGPLTNASPRDDKHRPLHTPTNKAASLLPLRLDVAILANNHIMDHGIEGLQETTSQLDKLGIGYLGAAESINRAGAPVVVQANGHRIGIMAFCHDEGPMAGIASPGPNPLTSMDQVKGTLQSLKRRTDLVIISYHGGEEFISVPWEERRKLFDALLCFGADIVYAHHAHVLQGYKVSQSAVVLYGVGNFYMDTPYQRSNAISRKGAIFNVTWSPEEKPPQVIPFPLYADLENSRLDFARRQERRTILSSINYSNRCIVGEISIDKEWCRQAYNRFNGRLGLVGNMIRMARQGLKLFKRQRVGEYISEYRRDRSILAGATKFLATRVPRDKADHQCKP